MKLRHWASTLLGLGALVLATAGFLHHQQRLNALDLHQRDNRPTQAIRSELDELRSAQALIRSELDALSQQLSRLGEEHAQLNTRLSSQQAQLTGLRDAPEDPRWHTLNQRIEQLESRTATPSKPAVTVRKPKPSLRPKPSRALPALPALPELLGIELRGAERFLAVAPAGSRALNEVRLLRDGDRFGAWMLKRLDRQQAVFTAPGQAEQILALP
jgi:TolA-binding protein